MNNANDRTSEITFTTSSDTALATATAKDVYYNECKELRSGRGTQHWRVLASATNGSVEIHPPAGTSAYEIHLAPGAVIQSRRIPEGVAVAFRPEDVVKVISHREDETSQEVKVIYQDPQHMAST